MDASDCVPGASLQHLSRAHLSRLLLVLYYNNFSKFSFPVLVKYFTVFGQRLTWPVLFKAFKNGGQGVGQSWVNNVSSLFTLAYASVLHILCFF